VLRVEEKRHGTVARDESAQLCRCHAHHIEGDAHGHTRDGPDPGELRVSLRKVRQQQVLGMHVLGHLASLSDRAVPFRSGERGLIVLHRRLMNQHRRALTGLDKRLTWHRVAAKHHLPAMLMLQDDAVAVAHAVRHRRRTHTLESS